MFIFMKLKLVSWYQKELVGVTMEGRKTGESAFVRRFLKQYVMLNENEMLPWGCVKDRCELKKEEVIDEQDDSCVSNSDSAGEGRGDNRVRKTLEGGEQDAGALSDRIFRTRPT